MQRSCCVISVCLAASLYVSVGGCTSQPTEFMPKMECRSPNGLRNTKKMYQWKYDRVREVILSVLPEGEEGMPFSELCDTAEQQFKRDESETIGKLSWFIETVALEMETRGELKRFSETRTPTPLPKKVRRVPGAFE